MVIDKIREVGNVLPGSPIGQSTLDMGHRLRKSS
jgi:hypothetical protein